MPGTEPTQPSRFARLRGMLWLAVGAVLFVAMAAMMLRAQSADTGANGHADWFGGPFALTAPDGSTVTDRTLAGKPYAIFFGFTRCPDVCPTSLSRMARLREQLGADGAKFSIVFVSVDPGHDSAADVGRYVALFGTPIIGLTGTEAQLAQIKKGFGVFSAQVPQPGGDYTIDHTATIYLMTAQGRFAGTIAYDEPDTAALKKLRRLVA